MVFTGLNRNRRIRMCIALLFIAALVIPVSGATGRTTQVYVQPPVVNVSPQATLVVQPATEHVVVVTTTPVPQRITVVTTVPTTVPVVNVPRVVPGVTTATTRPTPEPTVFVLRTDTTRITTTAGTGAKNISNERQQVTGVNAVDITKGSLQVTTTGYRDPRTGEVLSPDAHPGSGLPGGKDISKEFPSGSDRAKDLGKGVLGGGTDYLGEGTPFDRNPGSNSLDGFLSEHGGNIPDPLAAYGSGRTGASPAQDAPATGTEGVTDTPAIDIQTQNADGTFSTFVCASDYVGVETTNKKGGDDCIILDFDKEGNADKSNKKTTSDFFQRMAVKFGFRDQQYEGEGGYTGGGGHSANDLNVGTNARITGKVVGGRDPGEAGLGTDTGGKVPALYLAIEKYIAAGGTVRGVRVGYQTGDSGLGQDIGGAGESRISGLKKAIGAQRFIIDPDAQYAEQVPWWMEKVVSPTAMAGATQINAVKAAAATAASGQTK
jgi:hypothetical protein